MISRDVLRRFGLALSLASLSLGCAVAPAPPGPVAVSTMTPVTSAIPSVQPSAMPSAGEVIPCDPTTSPLSPIDLPFWAQKIRDGVLLTRCSEAFIQRLGQAPQPLGISRDDFSIDWLAPDASYAIGIRRATPATPNVPPRLVKRFADGRPDRVFQSESVHQVMVSPDGRTIALLSTRMVGEPPMSRAVLSLMNAESGEVRDLGAAVMGIWTQWSPDGRRLMYEQWNTDVGFTDPVDLERPVLSLAWTSWDEPISHRIPGNAAVLYDLRRGMATWAPDSRRLLIYDQNPLIPDKKANLVTIDVDGKETSRPIMDQRGQPLRQFVPSDVAPGNRLVLGREGLLDSETGRVIPFDTEHLLRWSLEPGKLLRWQMTPEGPRLDTVPGPTGTP